MDVLVLGDGRLLRDLDVRLRRVLDDDPEPAGRHLSDRLGRSVSGMGGTGAGIGTIGAIYLTGWVADHYSFAPILIGASIVPLVAMAAVLLLVRNTAAMDRGVLRRI